MKRAAIISTFLLAVPSFVLSQTSQPSSSPTYLNDPDSLVEQWDISGKATTISDPANQPGWNKLTEIQRDAKIAEYKKYLATLKAAQDEVKAAVTNQKVFWTVSVVDVAKAKAGNGIVLATISLGGANIYTTFPSAKSDILSKLIPGDIIKLTGILKEIHTYATTDNKIQFGPLLPSIMLDGQSVETANKNEVAKFQSAQSFEELVIVVQSSGSMMGRWKFYCGIITEAIDNLSPSQKFIMICYNKTLKEGPGKTLLPANLDNLTKTKTFLTSIQPQEKSDPELALKRALEILKNSKTTHKRIVLTIDRNFNDKTTINSLVAQAKAAKIRIDTITIGGSVMHDPPTSAITDLSTPTGGSAIFINIPQ